MTVAYRDADHFKQIDVSGQAQPRSPRLLPCPGRGLVLLPLRPLRLNCLPRPPGLSLPFPLSLALSLPRWPSRALNEWQTCLRSVCESGARGSRLSRQKLPSQPSPHPRPPLHLPYSKVIREGFVRNTMADPPCKCRAGLYVCAYILYPLTMDRDLLSVSLACFACMMCVLQVEPPAIKAVGASDLLNVALVSLVLSPL